MTKTIYHRMRALNARMAASDRRGFGPIRVVLLLTTTGRKSGQPRVTPLQYEKVNGDIQIRDRTFAALAEPVTDPRRIAGFIELRLKRHPFMSRLIMRLFDGLLLRFKRATLEGMAVGKALVILHLSGE